MHDLQRHFGLEGFSGLVPLFPLPNVVLFPCTLLPLHIFEPRYRRMVEEAAAKEGCIGMVLLRPGYEAEYHGTPPIHPVACLGKMIETTKLADGRYNIVLCGVKRARIVETVSKAPYRTARVELLEDTGEEGREAEAYDLRERLLVLAREVPPALLKHRNLASALAKLDAPLGCCADLMSVSLLLPPPSKQQLLEEVDVFARAHTLIRAVEARVRELAGVTGQRRRFPPEPSIN